MRIALLQESAVALMLLGAGPGVHPQPSQLPQPVLDKLKADTAALAAERANAESNRAPHCPLANELRKLLERLDKQPRRPAVRPTEK